MQDDMKALGRLYHGYHDAHQAFAASWEEAIAFCRESGDSHGAEVLDRLRKEGVVVHWGMTFMDARVGTSNYVFAYEKKTPMEGGLALHLDGFTEALTPGQLLTFLAHQADNDLKVFGKTPPYPVKFAPGTTPELSHNLVSLDMNRPWPPDDPIIGVKPPAPQPTSQDVAKKPSKGGHLPPKLGRESASSKSETSPEPTPPANRPATSAPDRSRPSGGDGKPDLPFLPGRPDTPESWPRTPFGPGAEPDGTGTMVPSAADRARSGRQPPVSFGGGPQFGNSTTNVKTIDSPLVGGTGGGPRRSVDRDGRPMIGVRHAMGSWAGQDALRSFDPLFERGRARPGSEELFAKDGYAVGAIQVDGDKYVNAIRVAFMRIEGDRLNPKDSYVSEWLGKPTGRPSKTLNGDGAFVVGVHGRGTIILDAIGLVFKAE